MNTCDTCRYSEIRQEEFMLCLLLGQDNEALEGSDIGVYPDSVPIAVEAKFGCIHHRPK